MKTCLLLAAALIVCTFATSAFAADEDRIRLAVVPFDVAPNLEAEEPDLGASLGIFTGAVLSGGYEVIDRAALDKARLEMKKLVSELQDSLELGVPLGYLMKAKMLIYGRVSPFGGRIVLHMKVLYVAEKKWGKTESCMAGSIDSLPEAVPLLLARLGFPKSEAGEKSPEDPAAKAPAEPPSFPAPRVRDPVKPQNPAKPLRPRDPGSFLKQLDSPDAGMRFAAAVELGKSGDKKAVGRLVRVMQEDLDTFVKRAAARSLGELHAVSAVPALIECLADKEIFVAITVHKSLQRITRHDFGYRDGLTRSEITRLVETAKAWWAENKGK